MTDPKDKSGCLKPENLKGKPAACSAAQIRICHGDDPGHPCTSPKPVKKPAKA